MFPNQRALRGLLLCLVALSTSACATRYQDLLAERDDTIRDLELQAAQLRAENEELRRQNRSDLVAPPSQPNTSELDSIRGSLPDAVEIGYSSAGFLSLTIRDDVTFDLGSVELKPSATSILRSVANTLKTSYAGKRIYVAGHTDSAPITNPSSRFRSNVHLSAERADAVRRFLIQQGGLPERQMAIVGYGPFLPKSSGSGPLADAQDRRVEIIVGEDL